MFANFNFIKIIILSRSLHLLYMLSNPLFPPAMHCEDYAISRQRLSVIGEGGCRRRSFVWFSNLPPLAENIKDVELLHRATLRTLAVSRNIRGKPR